MKTQLLKMTPRDFCAATQACYEGTCFALWYKTMCSVWEHCPSELVREAARVTGEALP